MTSNFSFIPSTLTQTPQTVTISQELPVFKELAYDFQTGQLKTIGGQYYYVEKNEALKIWIYKALKAARYAYLAYTSDYGEEIHTLIGWYLKGDVLYSELKRMIEETLLVNPYILSLSDFEVERKGANVAVSYAVDTIYGTIQDLNYLYSYAN